ncbi:MAG: AAA family ATPase [Candidatus Methylomirabilota bacterium]
MKILRLTGHNFKKIRAVDITPDPNENVIIIGGRNSQGKTCVLDMIQGAIDFASMQKRTPQPIREGAEHADIDLDLSEIEIKRTFTDNETHYLTVRLKDDARTKVPSPQAFLDKLVGKLSFDPLAFMRMEGKDQRGALFRLDPGLERVLVELDAEYGTAFAERTGVNRSLKQQQGALAKLPLPAADLPDSEISAADLLKAIQAAQDARLANATQRQRLETLRTEAKTAKQDLEKLDREIAELETRLASLRQDRENTQREFDGLVERGTRIAAEVATLVDPDLTSLQDQLANLEQRNDAIRGGQKYRIQRADAERLQAQSDALTARLTEIEATKATALQHATFPVAGLGFSEDGVTFNGKPFRQASSSEQLRVSLAIAMALNPEIRVIRISDGSLLDDQSMALIREMVQEKDFQVWIEVVSDNVGIIIEDGLVRGAPVLEEPAGKVTALKEPRALAPGNGNGDKGEQKTPSKRPTSLRIPTTPAETGLSAVAPAIPRQTAGTHAPAPAPPALPLRTPVFAKRSGAKT